MGKLSKKDIAHVAKLANLSLNSDEEERFAKELSAVIGYVEELAKIDTEGIDPTHQTTGLTNVFREDKVEETSSLTQEEALSEAKEKHNGYFKVPAILTKDV